MISLSLGGCASAGTNSAASSDEAPAGRVYLFSEGNHYRMLAATKGDRDLGNVLRRIQGVICEGKKPKVQPVFKLRLRVPDARPGTPLDVAAKERQEFINRARQYLATKLFYAAGVGEGGEHYQVEVAGKEMVLSEISLPDLEMFIEHFTFALPLDVIRKTLKIDRELELQHLGYDYLTMKFAPSSALENRLWIWQQVLRASTKLKEAAQADGDISYELTLDMGLVCSYAVPVWELTAH